ncbi:hypothetical protein GCM10027590_68420 [Nocardiopsis nanhaiensis]
MPARLTAPTGTYCSRPSCVVPVLRQSDNGIPWCSAGCRVLTTTAEAIANCQRVPKGRDHARDVDTILALFPHGNSAPITLTDKEWRDLITMRDVYRGRSPRRPR